VIKGKESRVMKCLPVTKVALTPPMPLPASSSMRATPPCLLIDKYQPPPSVASKSLRRCSPMSSENPTPPQRPVPIPSKGTVPPRPVVSMAVRKPERRARVNKGETGAKLRSPMRSSEYADMERGLAVERAQTHLFLGEEGEGQQSCDTVVSKFGKAKPLPPIEAVPK
jgi:hypothetical protein